MNREDCYLLGRITGTHGVQGAIICHLDVDDTGKYKKMESLFIEINKQLVPFFVSKTTLRSSEAIINLEDVKSIEDARELVGKSVFLPLTFLPPLKGDKFYYHELRGFLVVDNTLGELGLINEVLEFPHQVIAGMIYKEKEVLFPVNDRFFVKIDHDAKRFYVDLPEGLVDIYM